MIQRRYRLSFVGEPGAELRVIRQLRCEDLYGDSAVEARVARLVHFAHTSRADESEYS